MRSRRATRARRASSSRRFRSPASCASSCTAFETYWWMIMALPPGNDCAGVCGRLGSHLDRARRLLRDTSAALPHRLCCGCWPGHRPGMSLQVPQTGANVTGRGTSFRIFSGRLREVADGRPGAQASAAGDEARGSRSPSHSPTASTAITPSSRRGIQYRSDNTVLRERTTSTAEPADPDPSATRRIEPRNRRSQLPTLTRLRRCHSPRLVPPSFSMRSQSRQGRFRLGAWRLLEDKRVTWPGWVERPGNRPSLSGHLPGSAESG